MPLGYRRFRPDGALDTDANVNENDSYCNIIYGHSMYVCICNAITDSEIRQAAAQGATDLQQLKDGLGVATCCGSCESCAVEILQQEASTRAGLRSQQHA